jgi:hypothetical protein
MERKMRREAKDAQKGTLATVVLIRQTEIP